MRRGGDGDRGNNNANFPGGNSIFSPGENKERLSSANVNAGGVVSGPVRVGSFSNGTSGVAQSSGASFNGVVTPFCIRS